MKLKSMTGFASVEGSVLDRTVKVEARSYNSRYLEVKMRLPESLSGIEAGAQALLRDYLSRGRVEVSATIDSREGDLELSWNREKAHALIGLFREMKKELKLSGKADISLLLSQKDVIIAGNSRAWDEDVWPAIKPVFERCFEELRSMREKEGSSLAEDLVFRMDNLKSLVNRIKEMASGMVDIYRQRLESRMEEMLGKDAVIDRVRLAQEAAFLADRSDITEELVRLKSHRDKFIEIMNEPGPAGRKLEFLVQEMNREANTIGAKAQSAPASQLVVEIKSELERVREQLQNIE